MALKGKVFDVSTPLGENHVFESSNEPLSMSSLWLLDHEQADSPPSTPITAINLTERITELVKEFMDPSREEELKTINAKINELGLRRSVLQQARNTTAAALAQAIAQANGKGEVGGACLKVGDKILYWASGNTIPKILTPTEIE